MEATVILLLVVLPVVHSVGKVYRVEVDNTASKQVNDVGYSLSGKFSFRGRYKGCKGADVRLKETYSGTYLWVLIGYYDNSLDAFYNNAWLDYTWSSSLDCYTFKDFWLSWDGNQGFKMGRGTVVGEQVMVKTTAGPSGMVNYYEMSVTYADTPGVWEWEEDEPPMFISPSPGGTTQVTIVEGGAADELVLTLYGSDPEHFGLTFTLDNHVDKFYITGTSLLTVGPLDYEEATYYSLTVTVTDNPNEVKQTLLVLVTPTFDETPVVTLAQAAIQLAEERLVGSSVGVIFNITDADAGDMLTCTITGDDAVYISTGDTCQAPKIIQRIDYDGASGRTVLDKLTIEVIDLGGNSAFLDFSISITDINDNAPVFPQSSNTVNMNENTVAGVYLIDMEATDADSGNNKILTYSIVSGNDGGKFAFDTTSNFLTVAAGGIDYETDMTFELTLIAVDSPDVGVPLTGSTTITVNVDPVNEFTPTFTTPPTDKSVAEATSPFTLVQTLAATDDDSGADGTVVYEIVSATDNKGRDSTDLFYLGSNSGEFRLAKNLDFDDNTGGASSHVVVVKARDSNSSPKFVEGTFTITVTDVNDQAPVFGQARYNATVAEDAAVGATVLTVTVTEYDTSDTVSLSLLTTDLFEVVGSDVKVLKALDYETTRFHDLVIRATDGGGTHAVDVPLTVAVADVVDEPPVITVQPTSLPEEVPLHDVAVDAGFTVTDPDKDDTLTYALIGKDAHFFSIDAQTGEMFLQENINRDGVSGVTSLTGLSLTVTDSAGLTDTQALTITVLDINDNTPVFSEARYTAEITENTAADTSIIVLTVSDIDDGDNAVVVAAVQAGDVLGNFKMVGLELQTTATPIDYEALKDNDYSFTLVITGTDNPTAGAPKTGSTLVLVNVLSQNEFDPQWVTSITSGFFPEQTVSEGASPGTAIATFEASDEDHGKDGEPAYGIVKETTSEGNGVSGLFVIDAKTGVLSVARGLDVDQVTGGVPYYNVTLSATDGGRTTRSVTGTVMVVLTGINDLPPAFTDDPYTITVKESAAINDVIMTIHAVDEDGDTVTYTVVESLASASGNDIILKESLDYETKSMAVITVQATDGTHMTETSVTINVQDVVDEPPVITVHDNIVMSEELLLGSIVGGLFEVKDADDNDTLTFSIDGANSQYFNIDENTGTVTVKSRMSREDGLRVLDEVRVTVTDAAGLSDTKTLSIAVRDVNDNPPVFSQTSYITQVTEFSQTAARKRRATTVDNIFDFTVTDQDEGANANYVLRIGGGNVNDVFSIDGDSLMADTSKIDYESLADQEFQYTLTILAVDTPGDGQPMTGTAIIVVKVNGLDEYYPEWSSDGVVPDITGSFPNVSISESVGFGTVVVRLSAVDQDAGVDGQLQYKVISITRSDGQTEQNTFSFNSTGTLFTSSILDADVATGGTPYYVVVVAAVGGAAGLSVTGTQTIIIEDEPDNVAVAVDEAELWAMRGMAVTLAVVAATLAALLIKKTIPEPDVGPMPTKLERPDMVEAHMWAKELDMKLEDF